MHGYLKKLSRGIQDIIRLAGEVGRNNNMPTYLVGGFVRDLILGVKNLDLDIVVEGDGIKFAQDFASQCQGKLITHKRFGTATVVLNLNLKIDIATARKEIYPQPACLPEVTFGILKEDLFRRDFTVNAMALSINEGDFGRLIDFFAGEADLKERKIRILHDLSFIDDPTRILRAIRFEKRYDFIIDAKTLRRLKEAVRNKMLEKVQPQRTRDELILILKEDSPLKPIKRIQTLVGFDFIKPDLRLSKKSLDFLNSIEREINWFNKEFPMHRKIDTWLMYFIGIIDSLSAAQIRSICEKFVFRKGEDKRILNYKEITDKLIQKLSRDKIRPSVIFRLLEPLSYEVILLLKARSINSHLRSYIGDFFKIYNGIKTHICGDDLLNLGIKPGAHYQKIFTKVLNAKLEGRARTKEDELAMIKRLNKCK